METTLQESSGLPPDFIAIDDHQKLMNASVVFMLVTTVIYILFNTSRLLHAERNGWETWTLYPLSYICSLAISIIGILFVRLGGAGRHAAYWSLNDPTVLVIFFKLQLATELVYMAGVTFPKVCVLILYLSIFVGRKIRIITKAVIGIVIINFLTSGIITVSTICQPFAFNWDKTIPGGHCTNLMAAFRYVSIPNILTDLAILVLPFSTLYRLQVSRTRKLGIFVTFIAGSLGIITSILRFIGFYTVDLESDPTYFISNTHIYSIIEPNAYFICSCLPGTRPWILWIYGKAGLGAIINRFYGNMSSGPATTTPSQYDISLGNTIGSHKTSVTANKGLQLFGKNDDNGIFIRLEETVEVDISPAHTSV
ncbi:hypothetical protein K449DRAFT_435947 [Hypoxylon sp. EC38]|nr:hypothetical protein K449DRAFT_435947 [Hypoxylon sp. EC38]